MLKRFWNYQLLLGGSLRLDNEKKHSKQPFFIMFIYMYPMIIFMMIFGQGGFVFYPTVYTLYNVYSIVNSKNKLFEFVPISKLYSLTNIYLYVFISMYIANTLLLILAMLNTQLNSPFGTGIIINNWKTILVMYCIPSIITSISLPIFFIKLNSLRKLLTISVFVLIPILLLLFKNTLPVVTKLDKVYFWESITIMPHYNEFILILLCVVIIPISIFTSYKLYKGKGSLIC